MSAHIEISALRSVDHRHEQVTRELGRERLARRGLLQAFVHNYPGARKILWSAQGTRSVRYDLEHFPWQYGGSTSAVRA